MTDERYYSRTYNNGVFTTIWEDKDGWIHVTHKPWVDPPHPNKK